MKNSNLYLVAVAFSVLTSSISSFAADDTSQSQNPPRRHHSRLTEEQKNCLKEQGLPAPGEGQRPDRSKIEAAFKACNIPAPLHHFKGESSRRGNDEANGGGSNAAPSQE